MIATVKQPHVLYILLWIYMVTLRSYLSHSIDMYIIILFQLVVALFGYLF